MSPDGIQLEFNAFRIKNDLHYRCKFHVKFLKDLEWIRVKSWV